MTIEMGLKKVGYTDAGILKEARSRDGYLSEGAITGKVKALQDLLGAFGIMMLETEEKEGRPTIADIQEFMQILQEVIRGTEFENATISPSRLARDAGRGLYALRKTKPIRVSFMQKSNPSKQINFVFSGRFLDRTGSRCVIYVMQE